jgi:NAD(P)-dependent dehydrogenase (short-subunit alcohol dehydrogenase family)
MCYGTRMRDGPDRSDGSARFAGDVVLVSGSTSGLGAEIARRFAAAAAFVVVTGRDATRGAAVRDAIGASARFVAADLTVGDDVARLVETTVADLGPISVLVNNAVDAGGDARLGDVDWQAWERILRVGLTAAARLTALVLPHMQRRGGGAIVNVASRAATHGTPRLAAYTAAKGGLVALTRQIAADYAADGIRCNSVTPGYILHETRDAEMDAAKRARVAGQHLTRLATAGDVAEAVLFLASRAAETITGIDLPVSGGSTTARALTFG